MEARTDSGAATSSTELESLESKITLLTELTSRVESLRQNPAYLRPTATAATSASIAAVVPELGHAALIRQGFEHIKEFADKVQSEPVQDVLKAAKEREAKDQSDLRAPRRRQHLKREYVGSLNCCFFFSPRAKKQRG